MRSAGAASKGVQTAVVPLEPEVKVGARPVVPPGGVGNSVLDGELNKGLPGFHVLGYTARGERVPFVNIANNILTFCPFLFLMPSFQLRFPIRMVLLHNGVIKICRLVDNPIDAPYTTAIFVYICNEGVECNANGILAGAASSH